LACGSGWNSCTSSFEVRSRTPCNFARMGVAVVVRLEEANRIEYSPLPNCRYWHKCEVARRRSFRCLTKSRTEADVPNPQMVRSAAQITSSGCHAHRWSSAPLMQRAHNSPGAYYDRKQPDGQISKNLSSPASKNIPLNLSGKSLLEIHPSHPKRGGSRVVTNARWDAMDATASGVQMGLQGGSPVSDRPARGRTALQPIFDETRRMVRGPARPLAETVADGEVVWSWRPDAGVKSRGDASGPTGLGMYRQSARRRWQTSRSPGRARSKP
jgi:hypothetical protein